MSRHEGVSCDACLKNNFKGRRYKCLRCYDYDLCASCFEAGASTSRHTPDHPVQCILSRSDFGKVKLVSGREGVILIQKGNEQMSILQLFCFTLQICIIAESQHQIQWPTR